MPRTVVPQYFFTLRTVAENLWYRATVIHGPILPVPHRNGVPNDVGLKANGVVTLVIHL